MCALVVLAAVCPMPCPLCYVPELRCALGIPPPPCSDVGRVGSPPLRVNVMPLAPAVQHPRGAYIAAACFSISSAWWAGYDAHGWPVWLVNWQGRGTSWLSLGCWCLTLGVVLWRRSPHWLLLVQGLTLRSSPIYHSTQLHAFWHSCPYSHLSRYVSFHPFLTHLFLPCSAILSLWLFL